MAGNASIPSSTDPQVALACPRCGTSMERRTYAHQSGITVDACSEHGVWLDAGELERIEAWVEGNERLASTERDEWAPRLAMMEQQFESRLDAQERSIHSRWMGWLVAFVAGHRN